MIPTGSFLKKHLNRAQKLALSKYMSSRENSKKINGFYRGSQKKLCRTCESLEEALEKIPEYEGVVYRGTVISNREVFQKFLKQGNTVSDPGFLSTSRFLSIAKAEHIISRSKGEKIIMVIRSRKGRSIESHSLDPEAEVIFKPGTKFTVKLVKKGSDDVYTVFLEEL